MAAGGYSKIMWVGGTLIVVLSLIATVCGILGIFLIHRVNRWNGYLLLVYTITVYQILYDISYFFLPGFYIPLVYDIFTILNIVGGTCVTLWVNVVSCVLLYTVVRLESFDVKKYYHHIGATIFFISIFLACITVYYYHVYPDSSTSDWVYFWVRVASIIANVIVYIVVAIKVQGISMWFRRLWRRLWLCICPSQVSNRFVASTSQQRLAPNNHMWLQKLCVCCRPPGKLARKTMKATNALLLLLITRLKYYPVVQIITRAAATWWDVRYGFSPTAWSSHYSTEKQISQFIYDVTNPMAGIGFFLVLLYVQPSVYKEFYKMLASSPYVPTIVIKCLRKPESGLSKSTPHEETQPSTAATNDKRAPTLPAGKRRLPTVSSLFKQRLNSKASSDASSRKGSEYDIQRDSRGIIIAIDDLSRPSQGTADATNTAVSTAKDVDRDDGRRQHHHHQHHRYNPPAMLSTSLPARTSSTSATADSSFSSNHTKSTSQSQSQSQSHTASIVSNTSSLLSHSHITEPHLSHQERDDVYAPYHHHHQQHQQHAASPPQQQSSIRHISNTSSSQQSALSSTIQQSKPTTDKAASNTTATAVAAKRSQLGSQHQLQALQQAAPLGWSSDTPQSIQDYLLAEDDDDDDDDEVLPSSKTPSSAHKPGRKNNEKQRVLSSSVPKNLRLAGASSGGGDGGGRSSAASRASSMRSSVMSIAQHPDDELAAASEHDDDDNNEEDGDGDGGVGEYDEEANRVEARRQDRDNNGGDAGDEGGDNNNNDNNHTTNHVYGNEEEEEGDNGDDYDEEEDGDDFGVDLDEDVVWEEIRRRIGELQTAYQHIVIHQNMRNL